MSDRLFVAVFPPLEITERLTELIEPRRDATPDWKWTRPENLHLTLAFFGDVPQARQEPLIDELAEITATAFPLVLNGAGIFGNTGMPEIGSQTQSGLGAKAVWLGAEVGAPALNNLSKLIRAAASRVGVRPDGSKFTPHLTLARASNRAPARGVCDVVESFGAFSFAVNEFVLVKSTLAKGGSYYQPWASYQLAPQLEVKQ
ncbi:MAG: RNA 2',3'-cyclic phosphodiesterase [Propionibacteriaceae bacterium]|nr:RNA 2',3'-cyclic phosphodiesterase [Propionibacteriaceae bacterium]